MNSIELLSLLGVGLGVARGGICPGIGSDSITGVRSRRPRAPPDTGGSAEVPDFAAKGTSRAVVETGWRLGGTVGIATDETSVDSRLPLSDEAFAICGIENSFEAAANGPFVAEVFAFDSEVSVESAFLSGVCCTEAQPC